LLVGLGEQRIGAGHLRHAVLGRNAARDPPAGGDQEDDDGHEADGDLLEDAHGAIG
jgi:hypothetical protein